MNSSPVPHHRRLLIIGSGPAGYTAAIYGARALLDPLLLTGVEPGGQLMITTDVENYPGFAKAIEGPWLMEQMCLQAENVGVKIIHDYVVRVDLNLQPFLVTTDSGTLYSCDALIIATGAKARWLGLSSEDTFKGFGVSACATCDGFFFRGREVVVVGGGNTAVEEALYLSQLASRVRLVHRRDTLRAERILQERLFSKPNIEVIWNAEVTEILGTNTPLNVTAVALRDTNTGTGFQIDTSGVFVAIGHAPASELFKDQLAIRPNGYIAIKSGSTATSIPGVFAAGDVADDVFRQAITAAGMGCMAALESERWLSTRVSHRKSEIPNDTKKQECT